MDTETRRRLSRYATTAKQREFEKQREFDWDFTSDVDRYEVWDEVATGTTGPPWRTSRVRSSPETSPYSSMR